MPEALSLCGSGERETPAPTAPGAEAGTVNVGDVVVASVTPGALSGTVNGLGCTPIPVEPGALGGTVD